MKLLLVDGHYYVYRSFFAIRDLSNSKGEPTNAIYGFVKTLRRMVKDLAPALGAVLWDEGLPTRRTQLQPAYKQQRAEMPVEMRPQLDYIRKLVPLLGFHSVGVADTQVHRARLLCAVLGEQIFSEARILRVDAILQMDFCGEKFLASIAEQGFNILAD